MVWRRCYVTQFHSKLVKYLIGSPRLSRRERYFTFLLRRKDDVSFITKIVIRLRPGMLEKRFYLQLEKRWMKPMLAFPDDIRREKQDIVFAEIAKFTVRLRHHRP